MKRIWVVMLVALAAAPLAVAAQSSSSGIDLIDSESVAEGGGLFASAAVKPSGSSGAFSRFAFGSGVSTLGVGVQAATNINQHLNLRATGNMFNYAATLNTNGLTVNAKLNLMSTGVSLDFYPFHAGFRISPGVLINNRNQVTAADTVAPGSSFTLNGQTFYSANANTATGATPVSGTATLGLNGKKLSPTLTGGWGNVMPRKGGHWTFPVEVGVAYIGQPPLTASLTGTACYDQAQTECTSLTNTTDPIAIAVQSDLQAQVAKWKTSLSPLKTYPIVSAGLTYSFRVR